MKMGWGIKVINRIINKKMVWVAYGDDATYHCSECGFETMAPGMPMNERCRGCGSKRMGMSHFYDEPIENPVVRIRELTSHK